MTLEAGPEASEGAWGADVESDFAGREQLDAAGYSALRGNLALVEPAVG